MIQELISKALSSQGAGLLDGLGLSSDKQEKALDLAKDSVVGGLSNSLSSGGISEITKAFSGGGSSSLVQNVVADYGQSLISKLGVSAPIAKTISDKIIPMVFDFIGKSKEAPTDTDEGVKGMLGDLVTGGLKDKLGGMFKNIF